MELATPHHPDRARRLTRPARLIGAHLQLGGKIEKSSLWPRWSSLPAVRRDDSCLERNRAPRGPQRMLTMRTAYHNSWSCGALTVSFILVSLGYVAIKISALWMSARVHPKKILQSTLQVFLYAARWPCRKEPCPWAKNSQ